MEITASASLKQKDLKHGKGIRFEFNNGMCMEKWSNGEVRFFNGADIHTRRELNAKQSAKAIEAMREAVEKNRRAI